MISGLQLSFLKSRHSNLFALSCYCAVGPIEEGSLLACRFHDRLIFPSWRLLYTLPNCQVKTERAGMNCLHLSLIRTCFVSHLEKGQYEMTGHDASLRQIRFLSL